MRSPASSCFKALSCGCATDEKNDILLQPSPSSDMKRRWSFGKRSSRHRILSNFVTSSSVRSTNKEIPDAVESHFKSEENAPSVDCADGKTQSEVDTKPSLLQNVDDDSVAEPEESVVIAIQTSIRGFLAQKELHKFRCIVKLQAAVRGHAVRQRAVGTLRCVQAIVKIQSIVRSRYARDIPKGKEPPSYVSIEKLLSNKFARQLIEATPKKRISMKCDASKEDSSWVWFERWTSISASPKQEPVFEVAVKELEINQLEDVSPADEVMSLKEITNGQSEDALANSETVSLKERSLDQSEEKFFASESEENLISYETEHLDSRAAFISEERKNEENDVDDVSTQPIGNVIGSRNANNPSFLSAQTLFAELSSGRVSQGQEGMNHNPVLQLGGSECGTELSVTSALDSPDEHKHPIDEAGIVEHLPTPVVTSEYSEAQRFSSPSSIVTASETPSTERLSKWKKNSSKMRRKLSNAGRRSGEVSTLAEVSSGDVRRERDGDGNSLPHFMLATQSAKAKLTANSNSPRSSPDVQDNTKRHSIPGASGRQVSPRIHRFTSQPDKLRQPAVVHERKWQR